MGEDTVVAPEIQLIRQVYALVIGNGNVLCSVKGHVAVCIPGIILTGTRVIIYQGACGSGVGYLLKTVSLCKIGVSQVVNSCIAVFSYQPVNVPVLVIRTYCFGIIPRVAVKRTALGIRALQHPVKIIIREPVTSYYFIFCPPLHSGYPETCNAN